MTDQERATFEAWHERLYGRRPVRKGEGYAATAHTDRWMTWIASRAAVEADRQGRMPSDGMDDVLNDALSNLEHDNYERSHQGYENRQADIELIRAALSRYSSGQPKTGNPVSHENQDVAVQPDASAQAEREKLMRAIVEAGQRAGIIRSDLETVSGTECLHILECLSEPAASAEPVKVLAHRIKRTSDLPGTSWIDGAPSPDETGKEVWSDGYLELAYAAPVAQKPIYQTSSSDDAGDEVWYDTSVEEATDPKYQKRYKVRTVYAAPVAAQAQPTMPPLTEAMRAVLRNEHEVYESEDALYAALCDAAGAQPVVNQSLMTGDEVKALYVRHFGGDAGWLDIRGSFFIEGVRAALVQQPSGQDREDAADMFWDADDPERFGGDNLHDTLVDLADDYGDPDFPVTVRLQCAKRLPDVQVVVTGRNDDGELVYEVIDAARAAKGE